MVKHIVMSPILIALAALGTLCHVMVVSAEPQTQEVVPTLSVYGDTTDVSKVIPASDKHGPIRVRVTWVGALPAPWERQDDFVLSLRATRPRINTKFRFKSAYQVYHMDLIDLTGDGIEEVVLVSGIGRGTSVTKEYLEVYQIRGRALKLLGRTAYSGYFAEASRWWYDITYIRPAGSRCPDIQLTLAHDEMPREAGAVREFIPKEEKKLFSFCAETPRPGVRYHKRRTQMRETNTEERLTSRCTRRGRISG